MLLAYGGSGGSAPPGEVDLVSSVYYDEQEGGTATATFTLDADGTATGGPIVTSGDGAYDWLTGGSSADYEVRATLTTGTFSTGPAASSWWSLGTDRTWTVSKGGGVNGGTKTATATFEIRAISNPGTILATATVTLTAFRDFIESGG